MSSSAERFYDEIKIILERIAQTQGEQIQRAAGMIADSIASDHILYLFGSGHSVAAAIEGYYRAGGLAPVDVIYDPTFGRAERLEGYAEVLLKEYHVEEGSVVVIISNSGRNAVPVEMALECAQRRISTVAITSLAHSRSVGSRHSSGKRLFEIADLVIDNCGIPGDAILEIEGLPGRAVPTSGIAGTFILDSMLAGAIENLAARGEVPPVFISANVDGGDEHNEALLNRYRGRVRGL